LKTQALKLGALKCAKISSNLFLECNMTKNKSTKTQNAKHVYNERQIHYLNFTLAQASGHLTSIQKLTASRILTKNSPIPCVIDFIDSMDYYSPLEFPKSRYSLLKSMTIKPKYKQNTNTNFSEKLLVAFETSRTSHHSPCSTIKSSSKIDTMPL
jgi:hypothetical protein